MISGITVGNQELQQAKSKDGLIKDHLPNYTYGHNMVVDKSYMHYWIDFHEGSI